MATTKEFIAQLHTLDKAVFADSELPVDEMFELQDKITNTFFEAGSALMDAMQKHVSEREAEPDLDEGVLADDSEADPFRELRGLSAERIRTQFTLDQNKQWARMLNVRVSGREADLSQRIFDAISKRP